MKKINLEGLKLKLKKKIDDDIYNEYKSYIEDLVVDENVKKMDRYRHHFLTTCFEHCLNVSYHSFIICKYLGLDYISAARGGLLHDLFLYDWRTKTLEEGKHAFKHPEIALKNAIKLFDLNEIEKDIIIKHMWPLTISPPRYKESFIVCFVDKYCASIEIGQGFIENIKCMV
ncbi:HD domain-containing protein [Defluviitalea phaphyphila]|uniref:HD domain-containing protein n=1 Tax=Defluviitalea phaphyphila TaxID=1473580 RepID=UPI000730A4B4|nr:HD domain-containing protein [Defluviitalea phaphyphila]